MPGTSRTQHISDCLACIVYSNLQVTAWLLVQDHLARNALVYVPGYGSDNVTSYFYTKESVSLNAQQQVTFTVSGTECKAEVFTMWGGCNRQSAHSDMWLSV